ncbi:hypothetical protein [Streptomyces sp. NPDC096153]|uniref:hypothetical protein n=1 Tax=Streptomyces sp. NPDC096153 TaxID=3155548 RepID=UPI00332751D6
MVFDLNTGPQTFAAVSVAASDQGTFRLSPVWMHEPGVKPLHVGGGGTIEEVINYAPVTEAVRHGLERLAIGERRLTSP